MCVSLSNPVIALPALFLTRINTFWCDDCVSEWVHYPDVFMRRFDSFSITSVRNTHQPPALTATQPGHSYHWRDSFFLPRLGSAWVYFHKLWLKVVSQTEVWRRFRIPVKWKKACVCVFMCVCVCGARIHVRAKNQSWPFNLSKGNGGKDQMHGWNVFHWISQTEDL